MSAQDRFIFVPIAMAFLFLLAAACVAAADEPVVRFDVPALLAVHELEFAEGHVPPSPTQKIVEVVIPVTSEVTSSERSETDEFRIDVYWNRNVYPLVDYAPKTQTVSDVDGLISVEKSSDKNSGIGINLSSSYPDVVSGAAKADLSKRSGTKLKYEEVPQHAVLVASGTIQRGTGAFFRFHPSKRNTLEGGRDLIVAYRVPQEWRGGVIKIECHANGRRKIVGSWHDAFQESRAFVVPIYLEGDDQARKAAEAFARSEQGLRQNWQKHQNRSNPDGGGLFGISLNPVPSCSRLPPQWVHYLIQSGGDDYLRKYRSRLPDEVVEAADRFVIARHDLFELSR